MLYQALVSTLHGKNIKKSYKKNKSKILAPKSNENFEFIDEWYFVSDIQDYFK